MTDPSAHAVEDRFPPLGKSDQSLWLVDFDHTLLAANSTEMFVAQCNPAPLVALIDFLIRRLVPWRLTGFARWFRLRDYAVILAITVLTPWNLWLWRRRAARHFAQHEAPATKAMLASIDPSRIVIVSFGSHFVIRALLRGSRYETCRVIATPARASLSWFRSGKAEIVRQQLGEPALRQATVLTDSEDDRDLLDACADGQMIAPQGRMNKASQRLYLPLRYSTEVKFTRSYVIDQWLLVDSCIYLLSVAHGMASLLHFAIIAPLLSLSFMCVYEIGYFENDMQAARKEKNPTLSGKEADYRHFPMGWQNWGWALAVACAALGLAVGFGELPAQRWLPGLGLWAGALVVVRAVFWAYNRVSPLGRMYLYPALQVMKFAPVILLFGATLLGWGLVLCQIFTMWVNYVVYRLGGDTKLFPKESFRFLSFVIFAALVGIGLLGTGLMGNGHGDVWANMVSLDALSAAAILAWMSARVAKAALFRMVKARQA